MTRMAFRLAIVLPSISGFAGQRADRADSHPAPKADKIHVQRAVTVTEERNLLEMRGLRNWQTGGSERDRSTADLPGGIYRLVAEDEDYLYFRAPDALTLTAPRNGAPSRSPLMDGGVFMAKAEGPTRISSGVYISLETNTCLLVLAFGDAFAKGKNRDWRLLAVVRMPELKTRLPLAYHGFKIGNLEDERWFLIPEQQNPAVALLRADPLSTTHSIFATVSGELLPSPLRDSAMLKTWHDERIRTLKPDLLLHESEIATCWGREGLRYRLRIIDRRSSSHGEPLTMQHDGVIVLDPSDNRLTVHACVSERGTAEEIDGAIAGEIRADFFQSIVVE